MIKIALKHWIYEKCINVLFDNISRNFFVPYTQLKEGEHYYSLHIQKEFGYFTYYDCTITKVYRDSKYVEFSSTSFADWGKEKPGRFSIAGVLKLPTRQYIHKSSILEIHH